MHLKQSRSPWSPGGRHDGIIYKQRRRQRPPVEAAPSHRA